MYYNNMNNMNNNANNPLAPIGFEGLLAEVNASDPYNIAPVPAYDTYTSTASYAPAPTPTFNPSLSYSNYDTNASYYPNNYDNYSSNYAQQSLDNSINATALPLQMKEAFDGLVKNNRNENFSRSQDFETIKRTYSNSNRFVDREFRTVNESVFFTSRFQNYLRSCGKFPYRSDQIEWKRAKDLCPRDAHFVLDKHNRFFDLRRVDESNYRNLFHTTDLDQGALGNCWFISAATGIIQNYNLFRRVVPFDNSFEDGQYCGAFHFRFWIYGTWKDVVVDDFLPVGPDNRLIFSKNRDTPNEFWCALFEKAYAKLCGSYEALDGGFTTDALIDMSGGIEEVFDLKEIRKSLNMLQPGQDKLDHNSFWEVLINARRKQSVIGSNIELLDSDTENEVKMNNGLVRGHAYICTKLADLELGGQNHRIMRLYNPWGNEVEWNGKWSDNSSMWRYVDRSIRDRLELKVEKDGEFWMSFEDWLSNFDFCQVCNLTPDVNMDISAAFANDSRFLSNIFSMWQCQTFHGQWVYGESAGGRGEPNREKFWINPQIAFYIDQKDAVKNNSCWVIVGLMQKFTRQKRVALQVESAEEYIQFRIFKVRDTDTYFRHVGSGAKINAKYLERLGSSGAYINKREVTARFHLTPGAYIIVPSIYEDNTEGEFMVRIFTEKPLSHKDCKTLNVTKASRSSSIDQNLANDIKNLSIGGSTIFNSFVQTANDFIRYNKPLINNNSSSRRKNHDKPQISCNQM